MSMRSHMGTHIHVVLQVAHPQWKKLLAMFKLCSLQSRRGTLWCICNGCMHHTLTCVSLIYRYSIPETPFSIPVIASRDELSSLINQLLKDRGTQVKNVNYNMKLLQNTNI